MQLALMVIGQWENIYIEEIHIPVQRASYVILFRKIRKWATRRKSIECAYVVLSTTSIAHVPAE